ncbi:hypothetical protein HBZC1_16170 [Helicobacter bizzozeronii CIII-1]|uniref:Lipoprotein n=1 Tax=Helicobacter bizzozeronii (strain CIII-1) TaxID=1002804 RepID=F8KP93_HELBC|nr:hypothetical protein [Helicobacter bizzozeronii]CCB80603.1 hypothetical protein HBZC1_16170 [Helicobacter bizzozeronii CIII-1]
MRVFHGLILACLLGGCGYKAPPFYKSAKPQPSSHHTPAPTTNHSIQEEGD